MASESRIRSAALRAKVTSAEHAATFIRPGDAVGMSGFTGAGYPKQVPAMLARRMQEEHAAGRPFQVKVFTGASTAPELDAALAAADGVELRLPYQSDPVTRQKINEGTLEYLDVHLSHVAQQQWMGFYGDLDVALVEVTAVTDDGRLVPSSSVGNNKTWLDRAERVILEVNSWQHADLEGMHDIYYGTALPPRRLPIPLVHPHARIGEMYLRCDPRKIVAIVETDSPDRNSPFAAPDETSRTIAGHVLDFLDHEVTMGRIPAHELLPLQSGVGNVANAVMAGLADGPYANLTAFTEVIQDGLIAMLDSGRMRSISATSFSLSPDAVDRLYADLGRYRERIVLRPQEISNHPELIRRLGVISMNGMIEADLYGNVNSTHLMGSRIQNGIGGSGDFARNAYVSMFLSPSTAKGGAISSIVPMVSHVDHTEHDVDVIVTEQGLADLRGLSPKQRARVVLERCVHPDYRAQLEDYVDRAATGAYGRHTPHLLDESLSWHQRFVLHGTMRTTT